MRGSVFHYLRSRQPHPPLIPAPKRQSRHEVNSPRPSRAPSSRPTGQSRLIAPPPPPSLLPPIRAAPNSSTPCEFPLSHVLSTTCTPIFTPDVTPSAEPSRYIRPPASRRSRAPLAPDPPPRPPILNPLDDLPARSAEFDLRMSLSRHLPVAAPSRPRFVPVRGTQNARFTPRLAAFLVTPHYIS